MSVFIFDKDTAKLYVQFLDQNNPKSEISARREILKPFKKLAVLYYQV